MVDKKTVLVTKEADNKAFEKLLAHIGKTYGNDILTIPKVQVIPHTSIGLNILTGICGIPQGRVMEFYGPEHGGKTTIALLAIAEANRLGLRCFYIDIECALDKTWAAKLGVDWDKTLYVRPPSGEKVFDIMQDLVESGLFSLGVADSVAAIVSEKELENALEDTKNQVGGFRAKIMACGLRKLVPALTANSVGMIFINQIIDKIGQTYGDKEETPGGRALKFYSSIRLRVNKSTAKKNVYTRGDIQIGHLCSIKIKKNKLGAPDSRDAEFNLYYDFGIDTITEIIDWAHKLKLLVKYGDNITYNEKKYTIEEFNKLLLEDDFRKSLVTKIYENSRGDSTKTVDDDPIELEEGLE
jgi:recombination protein RecA